MNILELDSFNLADAVKFHDRLNHRLWDRSEHLRPDVREKLLEIAKDFQEFLGVPDLDVKDITVSGSNAAYNYTPNSDIDLHLVIDLPEADNNEVYRELFDAKKFQYNAQHNIKIGGYDVELYVQNPHQEHHSQGIYSLLRNAWLSVPRRRKAEIDDISTRSKYEDLAARIDSTVRGGDHDSMANLMKKIKGMRQGGLEKQGEFGSDNLAFKLLRNNGYIKKLVDARNAARDRELSLAELAKPKQRVTYGFAENYKSYFKVPEKPVEEPKEKVFRNANEYEWFKLQQQKKQQPEKQQTKESPDGVDPTTKMFLEEPMSESPDGVNPTTAMFLTEDDKESVVREFIDFVADRLGITQMPVIELHSDPEWSKQNKSFGRYTPETHTLEVNLANRHIMDILRTTAHELVHCRQNQEKMLPNEAGETGSRWENQAHAIAGVIMRDYADQNPTMFENASGYIPKNKKEARDPRYSMALSVDIKPGQVGKEANKLALNTGRNGEPGLLMKSANLRESRMPQPSQGQGKYRDLNAPLGPEFKPTMPKGTVRVDVSDVYDWYKLGKHIPNLDRADPGEFGKGPPSTIVSFGDEDTEHKYIDHLKKLGLDTTDIDPVDPNQPKGMPRQKTDPTYNVAENELAKRLREELELFEEQDLFEINMGSKNLRREAAKTGALAGMEFEMIVPNTQSSDDDYEEEPDYDFDERCRSIEDAVNFFYDGDWNGRGMIDRMRERMQQDYTEWLDDKILDDFGSDGEDYIREWVANNVDESEWNPDDLEGDARSEALDEYAANIHADPSSDAYNQAFDEYREENQDNWDESDWLDAEDLDRMSAIEDAYSMNWPHWRQIGGGGEGSIDEVANEFENAIGRSVLASSSYHSGRVSRPSPTSQHYVVEPDGSLEADDDNDQGLEFVSPPLPIDEILSDLNKVKAWASSYGCYTNSSTGLHINISVPNYSRENLDFVKLALLMGDKYVLDAFGRSSNTYAKSALGIIKDAVRNKPEDAARLLDKMKGNLEQLATKAIHSGITSKYTSINTKDGHIEFRSPGGDWLDENFDKIENTLLRFTVAMSAALNPEMYRQEYLTKLYKLLSENNKGDDTIKYFSEYVAGKIPRAALRSFVKQAQLERRIKRGGTEGQQMWWNVQWDNNRRIEVVAGSKEVAKQVAAEEWGVPESQLAGAVVTPLRPYTAPPAGSELERIERQAGVGSPTLNGRASNPDGNYVIVDSNNDNKPAYRFMAAGLSDAVTVLRQWEDANPGVEWSARLDPDQSLGQPGQQPAQPAAQSNFNNLSQTDYENRLGWPDQTGDANYEIVDRRTGRRVFVMVANTEQDAQRKYTQWLDVAMLPHDTEDYGYREIGSGQTPGRNYEIFRGMNRDDVVAAFVAADDQAAMARLERYRREHPGAEYNADRAPVPGSTVDLQRQRAAQASQNIDYEIFNKETGEVLDTAQLRNDDEAMIRLNDYHNHGPHSLNREQAERMFGIRRATQAQEIPEVPLDIEIAPQRPPQPLGAGRELIGWSVRLPSGEEVTQIHGIGNNQGDANRIAAAWLRQNGYGVSGEGYEVVPLWREA